MQQANAMHWSLRRSLLQVYLMNGVISIRISLTATMFLLSQSAFHLIMFLSHHMMCLGHMKMQHKTILLPFACSLATRYLCVWHEDPETCLLENLGITGRLQPRSLLRAFMKDLKVSAAGSFLCTFTMRSLWMAQTQNSKFEI